VAELEIKVHYLGVCRILSGGRKEETIEVPAGATLRWLIDKLNDKYGERFRHQLLEKQWGRVRDDVFISVDGEPMMELPEKDQTKLEGKKEVRFLTVIFARGG
jgi:molybdopterin converting factor small subunit